MLGIADKSVVPDLSDVFLHELVVHKDPIGMRSKGRENLRPFLLDVYNMRLLSPDFNRPTGCQRRQTRSVHHPAKIIR